MPKLIKSPMGKDISCKGWLQEGLLRLLMNSVDPSVAEKGSELIVYGGTGKAARNWESFYSIVRELRRLGNDETLLIQSGKPVAVFPTHTYAPRVVMSNTMLVPKWATWEHFWELEKKGLTMFGQATAGSWAYISTQGILQGTCETFAELANKHFNGTLKGKLVLTSGLGGMGGAQPLAVTMHEGVVIVVEVDEERIRRRLLNSYCDIMVNNLDEALSVAFNSIEKGIPRSIALLGNAAEIYPELVSRRVTPDVVTDQTSAHDLLNGYIPAGMSLENALKLRSSKPNIYKEKAGKSIVVHVRSMLEMMKCGSIVFDYGNNIRAQAYDYGLENAFDFPGFVPAFIRPLYCEGRGPCRWIALSGDPEDIYKIDNIILKEFSEDQKTLRWIKFVQEKVYFDGLPARCCWLNYNERIRIGEIINEMVRTGELSAPVAITRDHTDGGSVASPNRETENMLDGSDAVADWPMLNGLLNASSGATMVSIQHGAGVGIGYSVHAGMTIIADGTDESGEKIRRVLKVDPGLGIIRHADAGYQKAKKINKDKNISGLSNN